MGFPASARVKREIDAVRPGREAPPRMVAAFRRPDNTICHGRCGRALALQGVRAHLEADFYCFGCLTHVTLPLVILDTLPIVEPEPSTAATAEASDPTRPGRPAVS